jgi:glycosyltransferase involved in cell wall biosynthesis
MLFQVKNVDSCLRSLEWAINHQEELAVMAKNAQSYVQEHYTWNQITAETLKLYNTLTAFVPTKPPIPVSSSPAKA